MKIAFVSSFNANDIKAWSGTINNCYRALKKAVERDGGEIYLIDDLQSKRSKFSKILEGIIIRFTSKLLKKQHYYGAASPILKGYAREIEKYLIPDTDVIFCPTTIGINYVKSDKLKVCYADHVSALMFGYNPSFSNLSRRSIDNLNNREQTALDNCDLVMFSSDWAKYGAVKYYNCDPDKIKVVPFGANIECFRTKDDIAKIVESKGQSECRLLFVGTNWELKGGDIVLETAAALHKKGLNVHLDIVGINDLDIEMPNYVENHGFLSKDTGEGKKKINELYEKAHFLILPTRADAYGIVFCEASSFGLPSLSTRTGGVPSVISDGVNGKLFELSDNGEKYAKYIEMMFADYEKYKALCLSSFERYERVLNWDVAGSELLRHIKDALSKYKVNL